MKWSLLGILILGGMLAAAVQTTPATGKLIVSVTGRGPAYIEGSIAFFRVRSGNSQWIDKSYSAPSRDSESNTFSLAAGEYEIESYVRPCDGNCGLLDPPEDRCRTTFKVKSGETLYAVRQQTLEGPCTVTISSKAPPSPGGNVPRN